MTRKFFVTVLFVLVLVSGFVAGRASAVQNHMLNARNHLRLAKEQLQAAEEDKGGHRVAAMKLVDDAIAQVDEGIEYARHH